MTTMKCDMAGAAAVVQATFAIAELGLPVRGLDVRADGREHGLRQRDAPRRRAHACTAARTVEVLNTDAEGRLILADALVRATEQKPDVILDVATLTGHMVIALGDRVAGVLGSDDVVGGVLAAGETAGEAMWPMPIPEAIVERVKASKIADLLQHDWRPLGRRPVRRGVPARVHRRPALGPPRHRRPGVQHRRRLRPRHLGRYRLRRRHPGRLRAVAAPTRRRDGGSVSEDVTTDALRHGSTRGYRPCCFLRRL